MPLALSMGIPYETFWHLNPSKLKPFVLVEERKRQERSNEMWLMGQYIVAALDATVCNAMPFIKRRRKGKYPEKPIRVVPLTEEEKRMEEEKALQQALSFFGVFEKDVKRKAEGGER